MANRSFEMRVGPSFLEYLELAFSLSGSGTTLVIYNNFNLLGFNIVPKNPWRSTRKLWVSPMYHSDWIIQLTHNWLCSHTLGLDIKNMKEQRNNKTGCNEVELFLHPNIGFDEVQPHLHLWAKTKEKLSLL